MNKGLVFALALMAASASTTFTSTAPARADDMMKSDAMKIDCTQAESQMSDAMKGSSPTMTGDVDKDFMMIAMDREKGSMTIMRIEAQCGKDPKTKAFAAKQAAAEEQRMALFRNQGMSQ